ncbi:G patch domain and ankyrin repeat-containing protein 1 [Latimeria chalumnae]|uniref:G-patch domain and ankyrin repeats 1 n=1 Tax=Latimeria chalumnae TaxID=7897 RepID=H3AHK5_LATCH|nr:PREDICTED: G patch domain and ankyrin repeat-containing protein 1 [Latimeria chalumnae]|eukprot:XP_006010610.1 PREDICTED: G patch domain and ankyrin repeat-containing protein 1 [Latimeria chalumnae]
MNKIQLITFTRAKEKSDQWENGELQSRRTPHGNSGHTWSGEEAKNFYEGVLASRGGQSSETGQMRPAPRRKVKAERASTQWHQGPPPAVAGEVAERYGHQMLKSAQDGDLRKLRELIESGKCEVNFRDCYYWTAMMCAAYAGRAEAVRYLLRCGAAWVGVCESQGRDALDLAEEAGHIEVVQILQSCQLVQQEQQTRLHAPAERKHCEVCKTDYHEDTVEQHERSTIHLFNQSRGLTPTHYCIPENNVGYRLLVKEGWDRDSGLGPQGKGHKFPVKTVLKRDQKGLGFRTDLKAKVTHFGPNDAEAVRRPRQHCCSSSRTERVTTISRREERRRAEKARAWERDLRTYMNVDF